MNVAASDIVAGKDIDTIITDVKNKVFAVITPQQYAEISGKAAPLLFTMGMPKLVSLQSSSKCNFYDVRAAVNVGHTY